MFRKQRLFHEEGDFLLLSLPRDSSANHSLWTCRAWRDPPISLWHRETHGNKTVPEKTPLSLVRRYPLENNIIAPCCPGRWSSRLTAHHSTKIHGAGHHLTDSGLWINCEREAKIVCLPDALTIAVVPSVRHLAWLAARRSTAVAMPRTGW